MKSQGNTFTLKRICIGNRILYDEVVISLPFAGVSLLFGKSGEGKTTLINNLFYENFDLCTLVSQENNLIFKELSVIENINMKNETINEEIRKVLKKLKLEKLLERKIEHLSGGEKRIIQILRGFFGSKPILLIDEPTNNLDVSTVEKLKELIVELSCKKSIFIVTHDVRLQSIADKCYVLEDKQICLGQDLKPQNVHSNFNIQCDYCIHAKDFFEKSVFNRVLVSMLMILFVGGLVTIYSGKNRLIKKIPENQIDICSILYMQPEKLLKKGYLPSFLYQENDALNVLTEKKLKDIKEEEFVYSLNLFIRDDSDYKKYELLMMDLKKKKLYSVMQYYRENRYRRYQKHLSTSSEINIPNELIGKEAIGENYVPIDEDEYLKVVHRIKNEISKENLQIIYYTLLYDKKRTSFDTLIKSKAFEDILKATYFIRSNETIETYNNSIFFSSFSGVVKVLFVFSAIYILAMLLKVALELKLTESKYICLRNMGCSYKEAKESFFMREMQVGLKLSLSVILLVCNIIFSVSTGLNGELLYFLSAMYIAVLMLEHFIIRIAARKYLYNIFTFRGIYDKA